MAIKHIANNNIFSGEIVSRPYVSHCFESCGINSSSRNINV